MTQRPRVYRTSLGVTPPLGFRLRTVVYSHGWFDLPPFHWDDAAQLLTATFRVDEQTVTVRIAEPAPGRLMVEAASWRAWSARRGTAAEATVGRMLGFGVDAAEFFALAGPDYAWAQRLGAGRLLRGATVFEDAVKMLATTNCSWALTRQMVRRLVENLGDDAPDGQRAFPTPQRMASASIGFYRDTMRAGYRAPRFRELAEAVADGRVDLERWANIAAETDVSTDELMATLRGLPGFGPYAAENVCRLLGRFDGLGLDSWCRKKAPQVLGPIEGDVDAALRERYARFGRWQGLALWLDLTRDWHPDDTTAGPDFFKKR